MVINRTYNIEELAEQLQTEIEKSKKYNGVVKLDILTANNILDVLNETNRREQKHQTLESALTNEMKESMDCFGDFDRRDEICVTCDCATLCRENTEVVEKEVPKCFGKYTAGEWWERNCEYCGKEIDCYLKSCKKECFGKYDEPSSKCGDCEYINECARVVEVKSNE